MSLPLPYARREPWHSRERLQRWLLRLLILGAIAFAVLASFILAPHVHFLLEQRRYLRYTMPADQVVLAEGTPDVSQLLKTPAYHSPHVGPFYPPNMATVAAHNQPAGVPLLWSSDQLYVFLHGRACPGEQQRLVSVVLGTQPPFKPGMGYDLIALAQIPATLVSGAPPTSSVNYASGGRNLPFTRSIKVFAGQPDPADESHFTIRCEIDDRPTTIDGWLMPDDTIKLEPRN